MARVGLGRAGLKFIFPRRVGFGPGFQEVQINMNSNNFIDTSIFISVCLPLGLNRTQAV